MRPLFSFLEAAKVGELAERIDIEQVIQSATYVSDQVTMPETVPSNGSGCSYLLKCLLHLEFEVPSLGLNCL